VEHQQIFVGLLPEKFLLAPIPIFGRLVIAYSCLPQTKDLKRLVLILGFKPDLMVVTLQKLRENCNT